jgi:hypothetical protein
VNRFRVFNFAAPTTASFVPVTTGSAALKTLLQIKGFNKLKVVAWGVSFDGAAAGSPIKCELITTGTIFGTVTALADADIPAMALGQAVASVAGLTLGTAATGITATVEGTVVASRILDAELVAPTNQYIYQFPLGQEPEVAIGDALRVRVNNPGTAVNAVAWIEIEV